MKRKYSVILRGENFTLKVNGEVKKLNFVTTRNVQAVSIEEAKALALKSVENDPELRFLMIDEQDPNAPATIYIEEMYKLGWWKRLGGRGFTFYPPE